MSEKRKYVVARGICRDFFYDPYTLAEVLTIMYGPIDIGFDDTLYSGLVKRFNAMEIGDEIQLGDLKIMCLKGD